MKSDPIGNGVRRDQFLKNVGRIHHNYYLIDNKPKDTEKQTARFLRSIESIRQHVSKGKHQTILQVLVDRSVEWKYKDCLVKLEPIVKVKRIGH